ncbi:hypothetical protein [Burkholderia sp. ABCPW 14]|uniref:hypothetical protein n=1 Tax=Burkholderia sp. ABCPW 14 TaxID=1637860 RepID=UPI0012E3B0BB|nr:hypothetical protein [Burkholderia sp. ABCPW 14]
MYLKLKRKSGFDNLTYHPSAVPFQRWKAPGWPSGCICLTGRPIRAALPPTRSSADTCAVICAVIRGGASIEPFGLE